MMAFELTEEIYQRCKEYLIKLTVAKYGWLARYDEYVLHGLHMGLTEALNSYKHGEDKELYKYASNYMIYRLKDMLRHDTDISRTGFFRSQLITNTLDKNNERDEFSLLSKLVINNDDYDVIDLMSTIMDTVNKLGDRYVTIVRMRIGGELMSTVAGALGVSGARVYQLIEHIRFELQKQLGKKLIFANTFDKTRHTRHPRLTHKILGEKRTRMEKELACVST